LKNLKNQMANNKSSLSYFKILLNGILMGTANKIPGVSGGIVAIAIGFYSELILSLKRFDQTALQYLLKFKFKEFIKYINGKFLILIFTGIVISYFSTSKILDFFLNKYEIYVWSLFFGLVLGTIFHLRAIIDIKKFKNIFFIILGTLIGIILSYANPSHENDNLYFVFLCGIISVSGMILPGLSGSFLLMLLGNYVLLLVDSVNALYDSINDIIIGDYSNFSNNDRINYLKVLSVFTLGSVTGLITLSKLLGYLLNKFNQLCNSIIFGFIIGSLGVIWPWKSTLDYENEYKIIRYIPENSIETSYAILIILIGMAFVLILSSYAKK
tara:strand:+ start:5679 stop:6659 length:981 start_codon:yes stop_codon:yes gene_type:complete